MEAVVEDEVAEEQRPLTFNLLKHLQLPWLIVETGWVLGRGKEGEVIGREGEVIGEFFILFSYFTITVCSLLLHLLTEGIMLMSLLFFISSPSSPYLNLNKKKM